MTNTWRLLTRVAVALAIAGLATLGLATPAQAHPEVRVGCDPLSNSRIGCTAHVSGSTSFKIVWYIDDTHITSLDGRIGWVRGCERGKLVKVKAVVTDSLGSDSATVTVRCGAVEPLAAGSR
jgi:hypothetical protein